MDQNPPPQFGAGGTHFRNHAGGRLHIENLSPQGKGIEIEGRLKTFPSIFVVMIFSATTLAFPGMVEEGSGKLFIKTKDGKKISAALGSTFEDALRAAKMGPPGVKAGLEIRPPEGGIEGIYPVAGLIDPGGNLHFQWQGEKVKGKTPSFFFFEEERNGHQSFPIRSKDKSILLDAKELGLKPGENYRWYLGRMEKGKGIAQSRVYSFSLLQKKNRRALENDFKKLGAMNLATSEGADFLRAQLFYQNKMYHDMVALLEPLYKIVRDKWLKRLLFLGYVRLGRHREAEKYRE